MTWRLPCGHTIELMPWVEFPVYQRECIRCQIVRNQEVRRL